MAGWHERLADLPLRTKVTITVVGAAVAALGISSYFSFLYWQEQATSAAREQALLAAESSRTAVESALAFGRTEQARRNLRRLVDQGSILRARVYGPDGTVILSGRPEEEGRREAGVWIPNAREVPLDGLVSRTEGGDAVRAFLPLRTPDAAVFEVRFSVRPVEQAMERGTRLGLGLAVGSVLALALIFFAMVRREVVEPVERIQNLLSGSSAPSAGGRPGDFGRVERSIAELMEKEAEAEQEAARRRRELEERAGFAEVGELAAEMAHELKRPLANIRTAVDLLEQEYQLDSGGRDLLDSLDDQLGQLSDTMADLFSLARPVELERRQVEPSEVLDSAVARVASGPSRKGIEVRREYDPETPPVLGDEHRLEQALANLVTNAVEAMPDGGVLTLRCGPAPDGGTLIEVTDTGSGIGEERLEEVMRPFHSTKPTGTGLGLPLVARIVAAHGGELGLESEPDEGTKVRMTFPPAEQATLGDPGDVPGERAVS